MDTIIATAKNLLKVPVDFTYVYKDSTFHIGLGRKTDCASPVGFNYREYQILTYESTWKYSESMSGAYRRLKDANTEERKRTFSSLVGTYISAIVADQTSVVIRFDSGISLLHDFATTMFDEDVLSLLLPQKMCLGFNFELGWRSGRSSDPWNSHYWKPVEAKQMVLFK